MFQTCQSGIRRQWQGGIRAFARALVRKELKNISLLHWKRGSTGKEEVGFKIAKVFETCQRGANINGEKKLEAKKGGRCEKEGARWGCKSAKLFESC